MRSGFAASGSPDIHLPRRNRFNSKSGLNSFSNIAFRRWRRFFFGGPSSRYIRARWNEGKSVVSVLLFRFRYRAMKHENLYLPEFLAERSRI